MATLAAERKVLLFSVGEVRLALRLSQLREIVALGEGGEARQHGAASPGIPVAVALGVAAGPARYALLTEAGNASAALHVEALHGILDLGRAEVFQLPAHTLLPQPPPFHAAIAAGGEVALELAVGALGWVPIEPAAEPGEPPPGLELPSGRELLFARGGRTFAVPLGLVVQVLDAPRIHPVPLAPASHLGLAYHGRAIHPVLDPAALHGDAPTPGAASVLLVDAGGAQVGLAADHILQPGAVAGAAVLRPSWDALFAG